LWENTKTCESALQTLPLYFFGSPLRKNLANKKTVAAVYDRRTFAIGERTRLACSVWRLAEHAVQSKPLDFQRVRYASQSAGRRQEQPGRLRSCLNGNFF
jgi:hypothetical protein